MKIEWGQVGEHEWGRLSGASLEEGVVRIVLGGVEWTQPPKERLPFWPRWRQAPANPQRFELPWTGDPRNVKTLGELGRKLREDPAKEQDDTRLSVLDEAVGTLLRCADQLHQEGFGLGLLHPNNVLVVPDKGGTDLLLPDLGFCSDPGSPVKPDWLKPNEFKDLWDKPPQDQQHVPSSAEERKRTDFRTLARLLACVLTGTPQREIADLLPDTSKNHQQENPDVVEQVWKTLAAAFRGDIKTIPEFAERLTKPKLSGYFFALPPPPVVSSLSVCAGPLKGGISVVITGSHLGHVMAVSFGETPATTFTANSSTEIIASAPAHAAGNVHVTVTTPSGKSAASASDQFSYEAAPVVSSLSVRAGPLAGGVPVVITGNRFVHVMGVSFGETPAANFTANSSTEITALAPAHAADTVDVRVTTAGGKSASSANVRFSYEAAPVVSSLSVRASLPTGGVSVIITGSHFVHVMAVSFGETPAINFTENSSTEITASAPAHAAGTIHVTVTTPGGKSAATAKDQFSFAFDSPLKKILDLGVRVLGSRLKLYLAAGVVLALLLLVLALWQPWATKSQPNGPPSPPGEKKSSLDSLYEKFANARDEDKPAILSDMAHDAGAKQPEEQAKQEKLRSEFLVSWNGRFRQAEKEYRDDPGQKFVFRKKVETLLDELKKLPELPEKTKNAEEKQCLTYVELLLGQF